MRRSGCWQGHSVLLALVWHNLGRADGLFRHGTHLDQEPRLGFQSMLTSSALLASRRRSTTSSGSTAESATSPMEEAFWKEIGDDQAATDLAVSAVSAGFTEQLDLDLHES